MTTSVADAPVVLSVNGRPFRTMQSRVRLAGSIFAGRYDVPEDVRPRRILDIGAGDGAFAVWCFARWPDAWIDCLEPTEHLRALLTENGPPGVRIIDEQPENYAPYQLVRVALGRLDPDIIPPGALYICDYQWRRSA